MSTTEKIENTNEVNGGESNEPGADVQGVVPADDRRVTGGHGSAFKVTRRTLLRGAAAGAAATVLPAGTALASHDDDDNPLETSDDGDVDGDEWVTASDVDAAATGFAVMGAPAAGIAYASQSDTIADGINEGIDTTADFLFGRFDNSDDQLEADVYAHAETVRNMLNDYVEQHYNAIKLGMDNAVLAGKAEIIAALNDGRTEDYADSQSGDAVDEHYAVPQESILAAIDSMNLRIASFAEREREAGFSEDEITISDGAGRVPTGVEPIHVELFGGSTYEAWALIAEDPGDSLDTERVYAHPLLTSGGNRWVDDDGDDREFNELVEEYDDLDGESDTTLSATPESFEIDELDGDNPSFEFEPEFISELDSSGDIDGSNFHSYFSDQVFARWRTVKDDVETLVTDMYDSIEDGEIDVDDLYTPGDYYENLAEGWADRGTTGYVEGLAAVNGLDTNMEASMTITVAPTDDAGDEDAETFSDSVLATNWRPDDGDPDDHTEADETRFEHVTEGVTLDSANDPETDVTVTSMYDPNADATDEDADEYVVDQEGGFNVTVSNPDGSDHTVNEVLVTTDGGTEATVSIDGDGEGGSSIDLNDGDSWELDTIEIVYDDDSDTEQTTEVTTGVGVTFDPTSDYDPASGMFVVDQWYEVDSMDEDQRVLVIEDTDDGPATHDVEEGEWFRIDESLDADGEEMDTVDLTETNRQTTDATRTETEVRRAVETQQSIDEETGSTGGASGGDGGGSMGIEALAAAGGIGALIYAYLTSRGRK